MENNKKIHLPTFKKNLILLSILSVITPSCVYADSYWNNISGDNQFFNQNNWTTNTVPDLNNDLYINDSNGDTVELTFDANDSATHSIPGSGGTLYIGSGSGNNATVKVDSKNYAYQSSISMNGSISVGSQGGSGTLNFYNSTDEFFPKIYILDNFDIGSGLNSNGNVTLFGSGKSITEQHMGQSTISTNQLHIGTDGGQGNFTIDGSSIEIDTFNPSGNNVTFSLGDGTNSSIASDGTLNLLNGGKLIVSGSYGNVATVNPTSVIGANGGKGTLNISGIAVKNGETMHARAYFAAGLELGKDSDSIGTINVSNGGLLATMAAMGDPTNIGAYVGVNNGSGSVLISGTDSTWQISGHTSQLSHSNNEVGNLSIGESGTGNVTIANGGLVSIGKTDYVNNPIYYGYEPIFDNSVLGSLYLANQLGGVGTLNIGAAEGESAQGTGTLEADQIIFGAGNGSIIFNHTDQTGNYAFDVDLISSASGQGTLKQINGVTVLNTAQGGFTGSSLVTGGTLVVNNVLGGTMSVSNNGTLAGSGTVGVTTIQSGGYISPGQHNSTTPSVLTIDGNFTMQSGATYIVNIGTDTSLANPYVSDLIMVNGDANLNGASVNAHASGDFTLYVPDSRWHILSATGNVNGQFGALTVMPFVNLNYDYDPQNVYLVITRNNTSFCTSDMSYNQCSTGSNIESHGSGQIYDVIASQASFEDAKYAFDQLSGEIHASAKGAMLEDSRFLREAVNSHLLEPSSDDGAWAHAFGSWGTFDNDGNAADLKRNIGGIFVGVDSFINDTWTMGIVGGASKADIKSNKRRSSIDRDDYHLGAYAKGSWDNISLRAGVGHTWHSLSSDRYVDIPGLQDRLKADYDASTTQIYAEGSYQIAINDAITLEPYINGAYVLTHTDSFNENGGIAKLSSNKDNTDMFFSTVGSRFTHQFELDGGSAIKTWGTVGWRYAFNEVTPNSQMNFSGYNGFDIKGTPISKNVAVVEVGSEYRISPELSIGLMYNGQLGNNSNDHGAKTYLNWRF